MVSAFIRGLLLQLDFRVHETRSLRELCRRRGVGAVGPAVSALLRKLPVGPRPSGALAAGDRSVILAGVCADHTRSILALPAELSVELIVAALPRRVVGAVG